MKIKIKSGNFETEFEESNSWEETKENCIGALHRVLLARDRNKEVIGVWKVK